MKFTKIQLTNYRQYKNAHFDLDNQLNIIVGDNGIGKSTLMSAIIFALYGISELSNTNLLDSIDYLANVDNYKNGKFTEKNTVVRLCLEIEIDGILKQYEIIRTLDNYRYKRSQYYTSEDYGSSNYETVVANEINGLNTIKLDNINEITKYIPSNILPLLFFDGERIKSIESVIDGNLAGKKEFKEEIERILQIETLKNAQTLINSTKNSISKKISSASSNVEIQDLTNEIIKSEDIIRKAEQKIQKSETVKKRIEKEMAYVSEQLKNDDKVRNFKTEIENIDKDLSSWNEQLERSNADLSRNILEDGYQIANKSIFANLYNTISKIEGIYEISGIEQQAINDILSNEKCICGTLLTEEMIETLKQVQKGLPPESFESMLKSVISTGSTIEEIQEKNERLRANYFDIKRKIGNLESEKKNLSDKILKLGGTQAIDYELSYKKLEKDKVDEKKAIDQCEVILRLENAKYEKNNEALTRLKGKEVSSKRQLGTELYLKEASEYIKSAIKKRQADISGNLQKKINVNARHLVRDTIHIKIDDRLKPTCEFEGGATSLSSGQSVMVSLSYLISLMQIAKEQNEDDMVSQSISYPIVMDGITAALDPDHIENMVESVLKTKSQVIFFVNNQTITLLEDALIDTQKVDSVEDKKIYIYREKDTNETTVGEK